MDKLSDYISHMQFKKRRVGGVDEENVLVHIKNICDIVRETMEEQERGFETTIRKLQENQSALKAQLQKYAKTCRKMQDINNELNNRIQELQGAAEKYTAAQESAERTQREYSDKYRELMATVNTLQGVKKEAEEKARQEMRERLRSDEEKARGDMLAQVESERRAAARQLKLLEDEIDSLSRRKNEMESSLKSEREEWKQHLDWFASRLGADGDKAPAEPGGYYSGYEADENGV